MSTDTNRARALDILHRAGIEDEYATTGLDIVCERSSLPVLSPEWVEDTKAMSLLQLGAQYGNYAAPHARALALS